MAAAALTEAQVATLEAVVASAPHATLADLSSRLEKQPNHVQLSLDALIRRGFVAPVIPTRVIGGVEIGYDGTAYVATVKGRRLVPPSRHCEYCDV